MQGVFGGQAFFEFRAEGFQGLVGSGVFVGELRRDRKVRDGHLLISARNCYETVEPAQVSGFFLLPAVGLQHGATRRRFTNLSGVRWRLRLSV